MAPTTSPTRSTMLARASSTRRDPTSALIQARGSTTLAATPMGVWGSETRSVSMASDPAHAPSIQRNNSGNKPRPTLSLSLSSTEQASAASGGGSGSAMSGVANGGIGGGNIHPLKYNWDVSVSHRSSSNADRKGNGARDARKDDTSKTTSGKEKETREDWEDAVVRLGGFSSIESLHPFMSHLTPSSDLPASRTSTRALFDPSSLDSAFAPAPNGPLLISDINIFRSPIRPVWEDSHNNGGGRWVLRLRKGCADRIFEEIVYALVGERIGGEGDSESIESSGGASGTGCKVNGVVLSVRKDEDILSLWCAPTNRGERETIRDSIRLAIEPLLGSAALASLVLDFKPHPVSTSSPHTVASLSTPHHKGESPADRHSSHHSIRESNGVYRNERDINGGNSNSLTNDRRDRPSRNGGFGSSRASDRDRATGGERVERTERAERGERGERADREWSTGGESTFGGGRYVRNNAASASSIDEKERASKERTAPRPSWGR